MIPILYEANETEFRSNGIGRLVDCLRCEVTEERNGIFELEFEYPVSGQHYEDIIEGRIIATIHDDNKDVQPFDIYGRSAPIDGIVTFYAHHISYRLQHSILQPFTASSVSEAFSMMASKCVTSCPFTFWTDKTTSGNFAVSVPISVKEIMGGVQGSILDVFGKGEYEWDKFNVKLHLNRGTDTGVQIRYGKNLIDLTQDVDTSGYYSAVVPYWKGNDGTLVTLPEWVLQSSVATAGTVPVRAIPLDLSDQWEEAPTVVQLRTAAQRRIEDAKAWLPDENFKVDFAALWQTDEYATVAPLEQVKLCDRVGVIHPELGVTVESVQVIKVIYDSLLERYVSMELGTARTSFAAVIQAAAEAVILPQVPTKSFLQAAIEGLSAEINAGAGGIITDIKDANGNRTEMLILCDEGVTADTPPEQCQHIWRINKAGIGYSSDYGQTYTLAITAGGQIVADFITTGTMLANIINGGTLTLGGANNGNGVFNLLNSTGTAIVHMDNSGLNATNATISGSLSMENDDVLINAGYFTVSVYSSLTQRTTQKYLPGFRMVSKTNPDLNLTYVFDAQSVRCLVNQGTMRGFLNESAYAWDKQYHFIDQSDNEWYCREFHNGGYLFEISLNDDYKNASFSYGGDAQALSYRSYGVNDSAQSVSFYAGTSSATVHGGQSSGVGYTVDIDRSKVEITGYSAGYSTPDYRLYVSDTSAEFGGDSQKIVNDMQQFSVTGASPIVSHELSLTREKATISYTSSGSYLNTYEFIVDYNGAYVNGNRLAYDTSSSRRYKHGIAELTEEELDPHRLYQLNPVQFVYNDGHPLQYRDMAGKTLPGFLAEDVAEIYPAAVIHNDAGDVESWDERRIIPGMLALIQEQKKQIEKLEARVDLLGKDGGTTNDHA